MRVSEWTPELGSLVRANPEVKKLLSDLSTQHLGFVGRLSGKNHVIVKHTKVPMCTASFSLTPSDKRAVKNKRADVERLIAKVIQAQQTAHLVPTQK